LNADSNARKIEKLIEDLSDTYGIFQLEEPRKKTKEIIDTISFLNLFDYNFKAVIA